MRFITVEQIGYAVEALERRVQELEDENAKLRAEREVEKPKVSARSR